MTEDIKSDYVCYAVWVDGSKEPLYCVGESEKDIVTSIYEWSERIDKMEYIGLGYATSNSTK